jgi:hypothetical protein
MVVETRWKASDAAGRNKVQLLYKNPQGIELAQWLSSKSNRDMLTNKRILYVVRANIDHSLIKFGIGGVEHGGTSAFGRLLQYVNYYGEAGEFDCNGIKLFLIVANEYNANVEGKNSAIFRKEKFLKAQLKGDTVSGRGTERVTTNLKKVFELIMRTSNKTDEDIEVERRKQDRLKQLEIQVTDRVVEVYGHETPKGAGKTKYFVKWSRPFIDRDATTGKETKIFTNQESYKNLIKFQDGKEEADKYKASKPRANFRD